MLVPLNAWFSKKIGALEKDKTKVRDQRVKFMNEIINGIKVLTVKLFNIACLIVSHLDYGGHNQVNKVNMPFS